MTDTIDTTPCFTDDPVAFSAQFTSWMNAATIILGIDAGHRAGALAALAAAGPSTSDELARCAGLSERHVREWLGLMTVAGIVRYEPQTGLYALPEGAAMCLAGDSPFNAAPIAAAIAMSARHVDAVAATIRDGGGIPYDAYRPEFTELMDSMNRRLYDEILVDGYIGRVDGLADRLRAGLRVADLGCGTGHVVNLLARAFPASTFVGYDIARDALEAARAEAAAWGLANASFAEIDVARLPTSPGFDLIVAFDAIHDQVAPRSVLEAARRALTDEGVFLMVDVNASSHLERNLDHPMGAWLYGASLFHCMQVSLAEGGEGLGTVWGLELAHQLLEEAGFGDVTVVDAPPGDVMNAIYVCRT